MATKYTFTEKQYNGTDYDILYPETIADQVLIYDNTLLTKFGLTSGATLKNSLSKTSPVEIVSYVGSGQVGVDYPCSITFSFAPKIVVCISEIRSGGDSVPTIANLGDVISIITNNLTTNYVEYKGFMRGDTSNDIYYQRNYGKKSSNGKTIYWYHLTGLSGDSTATPYNQLNVSGTTYYFLGIG